MRVIIGGVPNLHTIEHHLGSFLVDMLNQQLVKGGGRVVLIIKPTSDKHVPQVVGVELGVFGGEELATKDGKVLLLVRHVLAFLLELALWHVKHCGGLQHK